MTRYGKLNLAAMLLLPVAATLAALIVFGPLTDTLVTVFGINLIPMLIGGLVAGLLIRSANRKAGGRGAAIGLWPSAVPAVAGSVGYLWYAIRPAEVAPGFEYVALPQYLLIGVVILCVVAAIGVRLARSR
jgi:hypothetical protein